MKRVILVLILLTPYIFPQQINNSDLRVLEKGYLEFPIKIDVVEASIFRDKHELMNILNVIEEENITSDSAIEVINTWLREYEPSGKLGEDNEYYFIKKYSKEIKEAFHNTYYYGDTKLPSYFAFEKLPLIIGTWNDQLTLFVHSFFRNEDYYKGALFPQGLRVLDILTKCLFPAMSKMIIPLKKTNIKYLGLSAVFFSKDKDDTDSKNLSHEAVLIFCPVSKIIDYKNGKLSNDDLINLSDLYLFDKELDTFSKYELH